jgi:hypothetical protein
VARGGACEVAVTVAEQIFEGNLVLLGPYLCLFCHIHVQYLYY